MSLTLTLTRRVPAPCTRLTRDSQALYVVWCTQNMELATRADHVILLEGGFVTRSGTPLEVFSRFIRGLPVSPLMEAFPLTLTFEEVSYQRGQFRFTANGIFEEGVHLVSGKVGSGKSTLAFIASGLVPPGTGSVHRTGIRKSLLSMQFPEYHTTGISVNDEIRSWGLDPDVNTCVHPAFWPRGAGHKCTLTRGTETSAPRVCTVC